MVLLQCSAFYIQEVPLLKTRVNTKKWVRVTGLLEDHSKKYFNDTDKSIVQEALRNIFVGFPSLTFLPKEGFQIDQS